MRWTNMCVLPGWSPHLLDVILSCRWKHLCVITENILYIVLYRRLVSSAPPHCILGLLVTWLFPDLHTVCKVRFAKEAHVFPPGGVLLPSGVSGSHRGGGDAHQTGPGQGRTGEVSAIQRHLHRPQERKGRGHMRSFIWSEWWSSTVTVKCNQSNLPSVSHPILSFPALLFMPDQEVLSLHLVLHLPVLQKVNSPPIHCQLNWKHNCTNHTVVNFCSCCLKLFITSPYWWSTLQSLASVHCNSSFLSSPGLCVPSALKR